MGLYKKVIKREIKKWFLFFLFINFSFLSAQNKIIANVGNLQITEKDLKNEIKIYGKSSSFNYKLMTLTKEGRKKIFENVLREVIFYKSAIDSGIKLDEADKYYLEKIKRDLLVRKYIEKYLNSLKFDENEFYKYYEKNKEKFTIPEKRKVAHIIVKSKEEARKIMDLLKEGEDFHSLAGKYNIDDTKKTNGVIGWIRKGKMVKEFDEVAFSLKKGEISEVVKTNFGFHIIKVEDIKETELRKFEDVRDEIIKKLKYEKLKELERNLKEKYKVRVNEEILNEISGGERK